MDIKEFLNLSAGKWFAQRTSYYLAQEKAENSKADIAIEIISENDREAIALCEQSKINPNGSLIGTKMSWDNSVDWGKPKQIGSALIILVPDVDNPQFGQLLRTSQNSDKIPNTGRYAIASDESLTLIVENGEIYFEERQWFASPNLRLRTTFVKNATGTTATSFYSEIRRMPPKTEQTGDN